uniref:Putative lipocalin-3 1 n=1 Tax=Amblyomma cajennense TaxID=34607 RepID=A0A023FQR8_AMBCJ
MAKSQCFLVFSLVTFFPFIRPNTEQEQSFRHDDIYKFLSVSRKLWVYNTTEKQDAGHTICRYDVKVNITEEIIFFHRFSNRSSWTTELMRGDFFNANATTEKPYNAFFLYDANGTAVGIEALEYASRAYYCAIFTVSLFQSGTPAHRELRVSENALMNGPGEACRKKYDQLLRSVKQTAKAQYSSSCLGQLQPGRC